MSVRPCGCGHLVWLTKRDCIGGDQWFGRDVADAILDPPGARLCFEIPESAVERVARGACFHQPEQIFSTGAVLDRTTGALYLGFNAFESFAVASIWNAFTMPDIIVRADGTCQYFRLSLGSPGYRESSRKREALGSDKKVTLHEELPLMALPSPSLK